MIAKHGFEVMAKVPRGTLYAYVPPCNSLKETIARLQQDDPCWRKPRIRVMQRERKKAYAGAYAYGDFPKMLME